MQDFNPRLISISVPLQVDVIEKRKKKKQFLGGRNYT